MHRWAALSSRIEPYAAVGFTFILAVLTYARVFFGISVGDEAHYAAMASLPSMGAEWFVHEKTIQQVSAMLIAPAVWVYAKFAGTTGVYLFLRHLHFLMSVAAAGCFFLALRHFVRWPLALVFAAVVVFFVPSALASPIYTTMGSFFFGSAVALATAAVLEKKTWMAAASAAAFVLCGFAYPTLVTTFFIAAPALVYWTVKDPGLRNRVLVPFAATTAVVGTALLAILLSQGIDNIKSAVEFSSLFASPGSLYKLKYAFLLSGLYMPPAWACALVLAIWATLIYKLPEYSIYGLPVFLIVYFWFGGLFEAMPTQVLWPMAQAVLLPVAFTRRFRFAHNEKVALTLIFLPGLVGSLVGCLTSRMTLYSMSITGLYSGLLVIVLLTAKQRVAAWLAALTLCTASTYWYYRMVYEDDSLTKLDYTVPSGPFAGLRTIREKGLFIEQIQADLKHWNIQGRTILFKDFFPAGYLMAPNRVLGPTIYFAPANFYPEARHLYAQIFQDSSYWPEVVVELKYFPMRRDDHWPYLVENFDPYNDPFRDFFMSTGAYSILEDRPTHRFLIRRH